MIQTTHIKPKNLLLCCLFSLFLFSNSLAQIEQKIDSLKKILPETTDTMRLHVLYNLSVLYVVNNPEKSIEFANKLVEEAEEQERIDYVTSAYTILGEAYFYQGNKEKSLDYFKKELEIYDKQNDEEGLAKTYNNLGIIYSNMDRKEKALEYYKKSLNIHASKGDTARSHSLYNNIGVLYFELKDYTRALKYFKKSLEIEKMSEDAEGMATSLLNVGHAYGKLGETEKAVKLIKRSINICDSFNLNVNKEYALKAMSGTYETAGLYDKALDYYKEYEELKNDRINEETNNRIAELQVKYETAKNEKEITLLNKQKNQREILIYIFLGAILAISIFGYLLYRQNKKRKKANEELKLRNSEILQQKEEIESQRDEIETQRDEIERQRLIAVQKQKQIELQKKDITDSIEYAKHIQNALFPDKITFQRVLGHAFYFFLPRDIVSGDFYWVGRVNGKSIVAAADCTGHGVPGAFMSIIGITFLNEIINDEEIDDPAKILNVLRKKVIKTLVHSDKFDETKDGMDISICSIDRGANTLKFAGAYNHLYLFRNGELKVIKASNMPVGLSQKALRPFTSSTMEMQKDDMVYMFTDGYPDQFGGPENKKMKICNFKEILINAHHEDISFQKNLLSQAFVDWKGSREQIDDVLVLGFRY